MKESWQLKTIAYMHTDFPAKFGVPRQSGLADTKGVIVFEPEYRMEEALRGIEQYSHLWLIWGFSKSQKEKWKPTVRPPRLGGNTRVGVFATRSPFRPNPLGLSCVKLEQVKREKKHGIVLVVSGVDMIDGTPIYDIKPYLPYVDSYPQAAGGFAQEKKEYCLSVDFPEELLAKVSEEKRQALVQVLAQDVRPSYQRDNERVYGMGFAGLEIKFKVIDTKLIVCDVQKL